MKIVIEISKDTYEHILKAKSVPEILGIDIVNTVNVVKNGTPLPKGHGRLIDEKRISLSGIHFETELDHAMMIGRLNSAPTIIEADKE